MLYSKLGSIPKPETDGTEGWIEVPEAPEAPEGKEVVWWYPPGWVVRDPKPEGDWNWSQSEERWIEAVVATVEDTVIDMPSANDSINVGTASPTIIV
ncbi:MAG: hypothetical protein EBR82_57230 [Caulobacteraceae bacterium]|nr:hypothetical protein [Caulobacteraceae bacterium]